MTLARIRGLVHGRQARLLLVLCAFVPLLTTAVWLCSYHREALVVLYRWQPTKRVLACHYIGIEQGRLCYSCDSLSAPLGYSPYRTWDFRWSWQAVVPRHRQLTVASGRLSDWEALGFRFQRTEGGETAGTMLLLTIPLWFVVVLGGSLAIAGFLRVRRAETRTGGFALHARGSTDI